MLPDDEWNRRERIDVTQDDQVRHWAKQFGVSTEEIKAAVKAIGDRVSAVERYVTPDGQ
jgi:hypothetical protein